MLHVSTSIYVCWCVCQPALAGSRLCPTQQERIGREQEANHNPMHTIHKKAGMQQRVPATNTVGAVLTRHAAQNATHTGLHSWGAASHHVTPSPAGPVNTRVSVMQGIYAASWLLLLLLHQVRQSWPLLGAAHTPPLVPCLLTWLLHPSSRQRGCGTHAVAACVVLHAPCSHWQRHCKNPPRAAGRARPYPAWVHHILSAMQG